MKVLGIRFCSVSQEAVQLAEFLKNLGLFAKKMATDEDERGFSGAIFPAGESWIEVWEEAENMPSGIMLQVVVDDADEFANYARNNGLLPEGPMDEFGERIYFIEAPGGLKMSFQSRREVSES